MVDQMSKFNNLVISLENNLQQSPRNKELLIEESFIVWLMLSEGSNSTQYSEKELSKMLRRNFDTYQQHYAGDIDCNFITGWMMNVAFWHFKTQYDESYGNQLLLQAYGKSPGNSLFKWSVRQDLRLPDREVSRLQQDICGRFDQYYNYGHVIKDYFVDVIKKGC